MTEVACNRCNERFSTTKSGRFVPTLCVRCYSAESAGMRWCRACRTDKPITEFYESAKRRRCRACYQHKSTERYEVNSARIAAIKLERGCTDCGYNAHPAALDFDHLPGFVKLGQVGTMVSLCWERIEAEIAKCEVVCSNCHRVRTHVTRKAPV